MVSRHTVTLANSIVGVSVLAMPFCFKQCGIVLATLSLMVGAIMTRMVCYFLLKAAVMSRRRTYEMLAWSTFGHPGKFMVEISIIGFLIGTLIAFMVVIGDLGPEILSEIFSMENNSSLRTITMTALSLFVALPLGLLRNIDSLSSVSTASVLFYLFLVLKIFTEGIGPLWSGEYLERIHFWKSGGVLQCIPIFSMALSCQTQIFGIYDALPEPSLQKMNEIVKQAVNICTFFYFCVGFLGYIAFSQQNFGGNILLSFSPTWSTQLIKSMFLMSVVFSVPLVVFPCRTSLHSMIFKSVRCPEYKYSLLVRKGSTYHQVHDLSTNYIPESRLKFLTVTIVGFTLVVGILIPNIELVLGLVGSTTGSVICIIFPSIMFVRVTSKNTTERLLAQGMFIIGVVLMLLTTYATLYAAEQSQVNENIPEPIRVTENLLLLKPVARQDDVQFNSPLPKLNEDKIEQNGVEFRKIIPENIMRDKISPRAEISSQNAIQEKVSHMPPKRKISSDINHPAPKIEPIEEMPRKSGSIRAEKSNYKENDHKHMSPSSKPKEAERQANVEEPILKKEAPSKDTLAVDEQPGGDAKKEFVDKQVAEAFLKKLEEHQENQKKLLEEQKEILEELKQHHAQDVREKIEKEKNVEKDGDSIKSEKTVGRNDNIALGNLVKHEERTAVQNNNEPLRSDTGAASRAADKITQDQEKIIAKISENIEKESKNVQLLEKFEEGLNKEVQMMDAQKIQKSDDIKQDNLPQEKQEETKHDSNLGSLNNGQGRPNEVVENSQLDKESSAGKSVHQVKSIIEEPPRFDDTNSKLHKKPIKDLKSNSDGVRTANNNQPSVNAVRDKPNVEAGHNQSSQKSVPAEVVSSVKIKPVVSKDTKNNESRNMGEVSSSKKPITENNPKAKVDREI